MVETIAADGDADENDAPAADDDEYEQQRRQQQHDTTSTSGAHGNGGNGSLLRVDTAANTEAHCYYAVDDNNYGGSGGTPLQQEVEEEEELPPEPLETPKMVTAAAASPSLLGGIGGSPSSPSSSFAFTSDEKKVPEELDELRAKSIRSRQQFLRRIHDLECRMAGATSKIAQEKMDRMRQTTTSGPVESLVHRPLERVVERLEQQQQEQDWQQEQEEGDHATAGSKAPPKWMELESRLAVLDSKVTESVHVSLQDLRREHLTPLVERQRELAAEFDGQLAQSLQATGSLVGKFDSLAGSMSRRYHEEQAARAACFQVASEKVKTYQDVDTTTRDGFLESIRDLRRRVASEREQRRAHDAQLKSRVAKATASLRRSLLDIATGDGGDDNAFGSPGSDARDLALPSPASGRLSGV